MANMNGWDVAVLVAAGYVGVMALVRLMIRRRSQVLDEFHERMKAERRRKRQKEQEEELSRWRKKVA